MVSLLPQAGRARLVRLRRALEGDRTRPARVISMDDLARGLLDRPWEELEDLEADHWRRRKEERGPGEGLRIAEELRAHALAVRPDWPSEVERVEDLAVHVRVAAELRRVGEHERTA